MNPLPSQPIGRDFELLHGGNFPAHRREWQRTGALAFAAWLQWVGVRLICPARSRTE